jgi:hypothetical protein
MKWIGQHIYDLVAKFRNDVYLEDLSTTTETNILVVDSDGKVSKNTTTIGDITGITEGDNITVTDPTGPVPTVALSTNVDVAGTLDVTDLGTFDASITVDGKISLDDGGNSVFVGEEAGLNDDGNDRKNVGVGYRALGLSSIGSYSVAVGHMASYANTGSANTAVGAGALQAGAAGGYNTALGLSALSYNTTGSFNIAIGVDAGKFDAVDPNSVTNNSVFLGSNTKALLSGQTNQIVIGYNTTGLGSNTAILGNSSITKTQLQGNVGIGTDSPANKLTVSGDIGYTGVIGQGNIYGTPANASFATMQLYNSHDGFSIFNNQSYGYNFKTGGTTRVAISNAGNVGIGTTGPSRLLHLDGVTAQTSTPFSPFLLNSRTTGNMADGFGGGVLFGINDATLTSENIIATIYGIRNGADNSGALTFNTYKAGGRSEQMRIDKDGNVGIGTDTPSQKLDVVGNIATAGVVIDGDTTITRVSAGRIAVEGVNVVTTSSTDTLENKTLTSPTLTTPIIADGAITTAMQKHLQTFEFNGYLASAASTNYFIPALISTNTGPFNHNVNAGASGTTALLPTALSRSGGKVMPYAGTCKLWKGWVGVTGLAAFKVSIFKYTPVPNDATPDSLVLVKEFSDTADGNNNLIAISEDDGFVNEFDAGDILITGISCASGATAYFTSTLEVEWN